MNSKKGLMVGILALGMLGLTGMANATLTTIGTATYDDGTGLANYNLIYDDDAPMGSITWLDYTTNTEEYWQTQVDWADDLNGAGVLTYHLNPDVASWTGGDWRLPSAGTSPATGSDQNTSELGHLYYDELGLQNYADRGNVLVTAAELNSTNFSTLEPDWYWTGSVYTGYPDSAWVFGFQNGLQGYGFKYIDEVYGLAVRPGQVSFDTGGGDGPAPTPEPATMLLFGTGIAGLAGIKVRRKKK